MVPAPVQGAGPARNAGVAASRGKVIAFIDSDCVPERDWIAGGVAALARFDFVGGRVFTFAQDPERPNPIEAYKSVFNFNFRRYIETVGFTGTGNMFVPRAVFDRVEGPKRWSRRTWNGRFARVDWVPSGICGAGGRWPSGAPHLGRTGAALGLGCCRRTMR